MFYRKRTGIRVCTYYYIFFFNYKQIYLIFSSSITDEGSPIPQRFTLAPVDWAAHVLVRLAAQLDASNSSPSSSSPSLSISSSSSSSSPSSSISSSSSPDSSHASVRIYHLVSRIPVPLEVVAEALREEDVNMQHVSEQEFRSRMSQLPNDEVSGSLVCVWICVCCVLCVYVCDYHIVVSMTLARCVYVCLCVCSSSFVRGCQTTRCADVLCVCVWLCVRVYVCVCACVREAGVTMQHVSE